MTTQRQEALKGKITRQMRAVARAENISPEAVRLGIANGSISIPYNPRHKNCTPTGIGKGLKMKVNANIGTSPLICNQKIEMQKLQVCIEAKADAVMDLSVGGNISALLGNIIRNSPLPVGTVPVYQAVAEKRLNSKGIFDVIEEQAALGVDFMTLHCGVTTRSIKKLKEHPRLMGIVSRGGALIADWMMKNKKENPLYEEFDRLLKICAKYDVSLSLGDGLRPGSIFDAGDASQIEELNILGELTKRAWKAGVQVFIEGPGHVPLNQIEKQMKMQKKFCHGAPFYVLGPLPCDIGAGYDHITCAIGGALGGYFGADFLCYVTPSEHLGLPNLEEVRDGIIAARIAAHCADIAKGIPGASDWDFAMSKARKALDWEKQIKLSINPKRTKEVLNRSGKKGKTCTMCGDYCPMKVEV